MTIDNNTNPDEQIINAFEPGLNLIVKGFTRSIISGCIGVCLGISGFAYGAWAFSNGSNIAIMIMVFASMLAIANANIISKNLYARKKFDGFKHFSYMILDEKIECFGEYALNSHKMRYVEFVEGIICFGFFVTMLVFFANAAIYDLSGKNIFLMILYTPAVCINALTIMADKKLLDLSNRMCYHWNEYLKYK